MMDEERMKKEIEGEKKEKEEMEKLKKLHEERRKRDRERHRKERKEILKRMKDEISTNKKEKEEIDKLKELYIEAQTVKEAQKIKKEILESIKKMEFKTYPFFNEECNPLIKAINEKRRETQNRKQRERREKQEEEKRRIEEAKTKEEKEHDRRVKEIDDKYAPQITAIDRKYPGEPKKESFTNHSRGRGKNREKAPILKLWASEKEEEWNRWKKEKLQLGL